MCPSTKTQKFLPTKHTVFEPMITLQCACSLVPIEQDATAVCRQVQSPCLVPKNWTHTWSIKCS